MSIESTRAELISEAKKNLEFKKQQEANLKVTLEKERQKEINGLVEIANMKIAKAIVEGKDQFKLKFDFFMDNFEPEDLCDLLNGDDYTFTLKHEPGNFSIAWSIFTDKDLYYTFGIHKK